MNKSVFSRFLVFLFIFGSGLNSDADDIHDEIDEVKNYLGESTVILCPANTAWPYYGGTATAQQNLWEDHSGTYWYIGGGFDRKYCESQSGWPNPNPGAGRVREQSIRQPGVYALWTDRVMLSRDNPTAFDRYNNCANDANGSWDVLTGEMKRFEYSVSPTGAISYAAPGGYHDDCVMALALANWGRWQMGQAGRMLPVPGGVVGGRRRGDGGGGRRGSRGVRVLGRRERCLVG